jgi:hypothetical protein
MGPLTWRLACSTCLTPAQEAVASAVATHSDPCSPAYVHMGADGRPQAWPSGWKAVASSHCPSRSPLHDAAETAPPGTCEKACTDWRPHRPQAGRPVVEAWSLADGTACGAAGVQRLQAWRPELRAWQHQGSCMHNATPACPSLFPGIALQGRRVVPYAAGAAWGRPAIACWPAVTCSSAAWRALALGSWSRW